MWLWVKIGTTNGTQLNGKKDKADARLFSGWDCPWLTIYRVFIVTVGKRRSVGGTPGFHVSRECMSRVTQIHELGLRSGAVCSDSPTMWRMLSHVASRKKDFTTRQMILNIE